MQEEIQSNLNGLPNTLSPCLSKDSSLDSHKDVNDDNFIFEPCLYLYEKEDAGPADVVSYAFINDFPCSEGTFDGYEDTFVQGWNLFIGQDELNNRWKP